MPNYLHYYLYLCLLESYLGSGKIMVVPVLMSRSLFLSKLSSFIQLTGNSCPYWTEHFISTEPPISVTISGWVIKEMVGLRSLASVEAAPRATTTKHILKIEPLILA